MFQKASLNGLRVWQMPPNNSHCCGLRFEKNTNHWTQAHWWIAGDYATTASAVHDMLANHTFTIESAILYFSYWLCKLLSFSYRDTLWERTVLLWLTPNSHFYPAVQSRYVLHLSLCVKNTFTLRCKWWHTTTKQCWMCLWYSGGKQDAYPMSIISTYLFRLYFRLLKL